MCRGTGACRVAVVLGSKLLIVSKRATWESVWLSQMLMDLGPNVYSEDFEQHFLAKAAEFYQVSHCCKRLT